MDNSIKSKIIVALDFQNRKELSLFLDKMENQLSFVKVGLELFCSEGPQIIDWLKKKNLKIFLDLKLHDIPNTVKKSVKVLSQYEVDFLTLHISGGGEMLRYAQDAISESSNVVTKLLGVTILTSLDQKILNQQLNMDGPLSERVVCYAEMAKKAKMSGVVCSPHELGLLKPIMGDNFYLVTPGIRLHSEKNSFDQKRTATPDFAFKQGATHLVIGRDLTLSPKPLIQFEEICRYG